jgi:hypothetical protein
MKHFVLVLTVALVMTAMLAASAVPALASPLGGVSNRDVSLATCSYWQGSITVVDGEFVCKRADLYTLYYY